MVNTAFAKILAALFSGLGNSGETATRPCQNWHAGQFRGHCYKVMQKLACRLDVHLRASASIERLSWEQGTK